MLLQAAYPACHSLLCFMFREYGRTSRQLMACLNGLLLSYGADLRPNLPSTHKVINSYVKHAWTAHTSVPVKVRLFALWLCSHHPVTHTASAAHVLVCTQHPMALVTCCTTYHGILLLAVAVVQDGVMCFCRLSLALGSMPTAGSGVLLNDVLRLVTGDINTPAFAW